MNARRTTNARRTKISLLKTVIGRYENKTLPLREIAFEYEADGVFYFSAFTYRGLETQKFDLNLRRDADGAVIGKCSCGSGYCRHLKKAFSGARGFGF